MQQNVVQIQLHLKSVGALPCKILEF